MDKSKFKDQNEWRKFGYGLTIILLLVGTIELLFGRGVWYVYFYATGSFILLFALAWPVLLKPLFVIFSYFGFVVNWLVTHLVLTVVFYLLITPLGWLLKLFGKKLLDVEFPAKRDSYWIKRKDAAESKNNFKNQY